MEKIEHKMSNLIYNDEYIDPERNVLEIVERKGIGHPDTLADALAEECSRKYSLYCMEHFGTILHHNIDKLYFGAGLFAGNIGEAKRISPIKININGRVSNRFGNEEIDLVSIFSLTIKEYLSKVLPHIDVESDIEINVNCTQNTRIPNWFSPLSKEDIPDDQKLFASDTSIVTAYYPYTVCENLALELEHYFWEYDENFYPVPKFQYIGQDIKVMVSRLHNEIQVNSTVPVITTEITSMDEYYSIIIRIENELQEKADELCANSGYTVKVHVNEELTNNGDYQKRAFLLCKGTCAECGEEGLVGRGNNSNGFISSFRPHSVEAPAGKNPQYHTGRVLGYLSNELVRELYNETGFKSQVIMQTVNKCELIPPYLTVIGLENWDQDRDKVNGIVNKVLVKDGYRPKILKRRYLV